MENTRRLRRPDARRLAFVLTVVLVAAGGAAIHGWSSAPASARIDPHADPQQHAQVARSDEVRARFDSAVLMLHAGQHEHAVTALHRVLELAPQLPEAHVNMGFALLGLHRAAAARDFFTSAMALDAMQANAYYGLAMASDELGDRPAAIGAMRSYLHLAKAQDERHLRKARAALWEWETARQAPSPAAGAAQKQPGGAASARLPAPERAQ